MKVIGTAGHVDHGKSSLVRTLTGINPDRLREEQEREMTIDLGFAWMELPAGEQVGIIDVPGHIDFIDNMLAGVGGIDAALLVIDAEEGVMPQTREHLAILDLLEVPAGVVALTKIDLVTDNEWLALVSDDVKQVLRGTVLESAPIVPVSSTTGAGLESLRLALQDVLAQAPERTDSGRPRLPVDRSFTIAGFGTIVTGTLIDGGFTVGEDVTVLPAGRKARIRGLQTHREKLEHAAPGSRVAINLSGVDADQVQRGDVIARPGTYLPTTRLDVYFRLLPDASRALRHNQHARFYLGSAQRDARIRLLGMDELTPGGSAWLQLELQEPVVAARGDHFILRRPSPGTTLGGGRVVDPHPSRRYKRKDREAIARLESLLAGTPAEQAQAALRTSGPLWREQLRERTGFSTDEFDAALEEAARAGIIVELGSNGTGGGSTSLLVDTATMDAIRRQAVSIVGSYHELHPLRYGMPLPELRARLNADGKIAQVLIGHFLEQGALVLVDDRLARPGFSPVLSNDDQRRANELLSAFSAAPYNTPSVKQAVGVVGEEALSFLLASGQLVQLGQDVLFTSGVYESLKQAILEQLRAKGEMTVAEVRDLFDTSRKYALAIMEDLDAHGLTVREGDARRLRKPPQRAD